MKFFKIGVWIVIAFTLIGVVAGVIGSVTPPSELGIYEFEITITDINNYSNLGYTKDFEWEDLESFIIQYGTLVSDEYIYESIPLNYRLVYNSTSDEIILDYDSNEGFSLVYDVDNTVLISADQEVQLQTYTFTTDVPIPNPEAANPIWGLLGISTLVLSAIALSYIYYKRDSL